VAACCFKFLSSHFIAPAQAHPVSLFFLRLFSLLLLLYLPLRAPTVSPTTPRWKNKKTVTHRPARPSQLEKYGKLEPKKKEILLQQRRLSMLFPESPFWHWSGRH
jgi:hypothetical protein